MPNLRNSYIKGYLQFEAPHPFKTGADRVANEFDEDAVVDSNGIVRWKSNNSVPPKDILEFWQYLKKDFDYDKSTEVREKESAEFLGNYRKSQANREYTPEELFEMRATFGKGEVVENIITGKKTKL